MRTCRLNLSLLRGEHESGPGPGSRAAPSAGLSFSRRELLQWAGVTAILAGLPTVARAAPAGRAGRVEFAHKSGRAAFLLDGEERWVIDTSRFAGLPTLQVDESSGEIRIFLRDARYPGTDLPADLTCRVDKAPAGWFMELRLALGGFVAGVPVAQWLNGEAEARCRVGLGGAGLAFAGGRLLLSGAADLTFTPDWVLRLSGPAIAVLTGFGRPLTADAVTLLMPPVGLPSILLAPPDRRSLLLLERKGRPWGLETGLLLPESWRFTSAGEVFDLLRIEAGENRQGEAKAALVAESAADAASLCLEVGAGGSLRLPLTAPRFAATLLPDAGEKALFAGYARQGSWLHAGGFSLLAGDGPAVQPFALVNRQGRVTQATCAPALLAVSAPMSGAVAEPVYAPEGTTLSISVNTESPINELPGGSDQLPITRKPPDSGTNDFGQIIIGPVEPPVVILPQNLKLPVVRPQDMMVLTFEFIDLTLQTGGGKEARLVRNHFAKGPAYIIVHFPPQHIQEQAFFETQVAGSPGDEAPSSPPVKSRLAGPSRLVFAVPPSVVEIPYTLEAILHWERYTQSVADTALPPPIYPELILKGELVGEERPEERLTCHCAPLTPGLLELLPQIQMPAAPHTAIEAPYRVILSPNKYAGWSHALLPVEHDGRTELWHTRLGVRGATGAVDEQSDYLRTVRAIWSPDYSKGSLPSASELFPFESSLTVRNRDEIVHMSADFTIPGFTPVPVQANRLMLSALGAWLDLHGTWEPPGTYGLEEWLHRAVMGRDTYVKTVEKGYLFPFGNRASLITVTERKFQPTPDGKSGAYLRRRQYVVVREPEMRYPGPGQAYAGRQMPFQSIRLTTLVTPNLDPAGTGIAGMGQDAYWLRVTAQDFLFHIVATDVEGRTSEYTCPLAFISSKYAYNPTALTKVAQNLDTGPLARRERSFSGQKVAYAPADKPGDTAFESAAITFGAEIPESGLPADHPCFYPNLRSAKLRISAVEQVSGSPAPTEISFHEAYLEQGFDPVANRSAVWAKLATPVAMQFQADKSGGVATPNMDIGGLSRLLGPVGGNPSDLLNSGAMKAEQFLSNQAKIFGGILLSAIIQDFGLDEVGGDGKTAPLLTNRVYYPEKGGKEDKEAPPAGVETKLTWNPQVKNDPLGLFERTADTKLALSTVLRTKFDSPGSPTYDVSGELTKFKIHLIGSAAPFLTITFKQFTFKAKSGQKMQVKPDIDEVNFDGPLAWVEALRDFLKSTGNGPSLDLQPSGLKAGFSIAIPSLTIGVVAIQNIKFSSLLTIPFNGDAIRLRFAFCERENPFILTVSLFGGGGFFAVELGLDKSVLLEASLEFGGQLALDIGVASGGVHVFAGIYFKIENDDCTLTGYLRLGGSLSVLGLITISAEFYMGLTYETAGNKVWGEATLTVKIEILFFSISVGLSVQRKFAGSGADPTFAQLMDESHWLDYCDSFAG